MAPQHHLNNNNAAATGRRDPGAGTGRGDLLTYILSPGLHLTSLARLEPALGRLIPPITRGFQQPLRDKDRQLLISTLSAMRG